MNRDVTESNTEIHRLSPEKKKALANYTTLVDVSLNSTDRIIVDAVPNLLRPAILQGKLPEKQAIGLYLQARAHETEVIISKPVPYEQSIADFAYKQLSTAKKGEFVGVFTPPGFGAVFTGHLTRDAKIGFGRQYGYRDPISFDDFLTIAMSIQNSEGNNDEFMTDPDMMTVGEEATLSQYLEEMSRPTFQKNDNRDVGYGLMMLKYKFRMSYGLRTFDAMQNNPLVDKAQNKSVKEFKTLTQQTLLQNDLGRSRTDEDFHKYNTWPHRGFIATIKAYTYFDPRAAQALQYEYLFEQPLDQIEDRDQYREFVDDKEFRNLEMRFAASIQASLDTMDNDPYIEITTEEFMAAIKKLNRRTRSVALAEKALQNKYT